MKIYAFDVDDTLDVSGGPISILSVRSLKPRTHRWAEWQLGRGSSNGSPVASYFQLHWPDGNVEGQFSDPAKNVHTSRRLHHGRQYQRSKRHIR